MVHAAGYGELPDIIHAHGLMMGLAFAFMFPFGATIMHLFRFKGYLWFHAGWLIITWLVALAAFGLGIWMAIKTDKV